MQRTLCVATVAILVGLPALARAGEPRHAPGHADRAVVQAGCNKCREAKSGCCGAHRLGCDDPRIGNAIETLMCGERVCDRRKATGVLEQYNWTQHPEIVSALQFAMQSDPDPRVRWDAADALKDMKVSDPDSIAAMEFSRSNDPCCRTRYKAKWAAIVARKSQPPSPHYVSSYAEPHSEYEPTTTTPRLERMPDPEPKDDSVPLRRGDTNEPDQKQTNKSSVRSFISQAVAKVRSRP